MNFKHSGSQGDLVYSLPTILSLTDRHGGPANLYLQVDVPAAFYAGCVHPAGNVRMNKEIAEALIPVLSAQPGIAACKLWEGEDIDVDLDFFRAIGGDLRYGNLPQHYFYAFDTFYDLTQPWLWVTPQKGIESCLVVARTSRYRNPHISYAFLDECDPIFLGLHEEFMEFVQEVPHAKWWHTNSFYEAAAVIYGAKAFVSNQCGLFSIAEALKTPRCLEVCLFAPNVLPQGGEARAAINQAGFEANVREIMS